MKQTFEYLQHAQECRILAQKEGIGDAREQLMRMADTWEQLASERRRRVTLDVLGGQPPTGAPPGIGDYDER